MAKFYICEHCGNLVGKVHDAGVPLFCCGQKMTYLEPNTVDASNEKHLPSVTVEDGVVTVNVGTVDHPMIPEHYIGWVALETKQGYQRKELKPGQKPNVVFSLSEGDEVVAVYEYCNLHGLWKTAL